LSRKRPFTARAIFSNGSALIQGWAAAEGFVAALVMATGAACEENLFTRDELASGWGGLL
jgi:hypothetical protein